MLPTALPPAENEPARAQPGPQQEFLRSSARVAVYGGAAGGGKSYACLLEPLFHIENSNFEAVIFRRLYRQIMAPGGLYTRSCEIYPQVGGQFNKGELKWTFPSGATVRFAHLQYDADVESWKGAEIALLEFDEATDFSKHAVFFLFSRNRSVSGVRPYTRLYTNPDPDSFLKVLLAPWVDETWPADDRAQSGEIRFFVHRDDVIQWVDKDEPGAISLTFVFANLYDNQALLRANPDYEYGLDALPDYERRRLKLGDWNARPSGSKFKREWFKTYFDEPPADIEKLYRFWDKAATAAPRKNSQRNGPDYTASVLMGRRQEGASPRYVVLDATWDQLDPGGVEELIHTIAVQDGPGVHIGIEQEGGSSGKQDIFNFVTKVLVGFAAEGIPSTGSKELRADAFAAQCRVGNVGLVRGWWNAGFLNFLCAFPDPRIHDDVVDACSGSFNQLYLQMKKDASEHLDALRKRATLQKGRALPSAQGHLPQQPYQQPPWLPQKREPYWEKGFK